MSLGVELDHLVWATPDLERGMAHLERRIGAAAVPGGRHPGVGTRNALLKLGARRYLEILAPDPSQDSFSGFGRWVAELGDPRLVTWALATSDLDAWAGAARAAGLEVAKIRDMHRERPGGERLRWRLGALELDQNGLLPFAIQWYSRHPCDDLPATGCRLLELRLHSPSHRRLQEQLGALSCPLSRDIRTLPGPHQLTAVLDTPRGRIELN